MWISCLRQSIRKFREFRKVKMWEVPFLRVAVQLRADIRLDYFGHGLSVRMEVVNGRRQPLFGGTQSQHFAWRCWNMWRPTVCSDSQGFVFVFSQDLVIGLQSKPWRREHQSVFRTHDVNEKPSPKTKELFRLTCQGNLCPQPLKCPARGSPSRRECFHCTETKAYCFTHTPTHQLCITIITCFWFDGSNQWLFYYV